MPKHKTERVNERRSQLVQKIAECEKVVREFTDSESWKIVSKDIKQMNESIDNTWVMQFDEKKLNEMRITKFAVMYLLDIVGRYNSDLALAKQELYQIDNPNTVLNKYYDTESNTLE